ncbi:hypothetical protein NQZ71_19535 (plasmid) [Niallia taxi]|uniref:hypothetical protein n=1 Tax=Niallia taxi TaxID=2499688 RepID=UPI0023A9A2E9|nr:hypothetical protein [Niallia taxi]MDE5052736.1 hypothetical protein [Niallia taxi]WOD65421.1 hypothetical protein NQZ71_19535 [Niallia taxi]
MAKIQMVLTALGFFFMLLYGIYLGGYSTAIFFEKYTLVICLVFLSAGLLLEAYLYIKQKVEKSLNKE